MLRIGIVTPKVGRNDGVGRVNYEIAAEALRQGHEVVLYCEHVDADLLNRRNVRPELMPASWLPTRLLKDQLFALRSFGRLSLRPSMRGPQRLPKCDAMLANGFVTWAKVDVNAVHFVHKAWRESPHHPWSKERTVYTMYRRLLNDVGSVQESVAFRRSQAIVAVSDKVREELVGIGVPASRITTIVNGVDLAEFQPGSADRIAFNLPTDAIIALFAGDLKDSRKNLETVLNALPHVPELHLAVAGDALRTPWPRLAAELGVADRVHFLGFQRKMPELMRAVDFLVFPSRYEACTLVLLEALASGLPVITARSAGGAELVTAQAGIVLEDSEDCPALAQALYALHSSADLRQAMSRCARTQAQNFSWQGMAARYINLLEAAARHNRVASFASGKRDRNRGQSSAAKF